MDKNKNGYGVFIVFGAILLILVVASPIITNCLLSNFDFKTAVGLGNDDWLNFWGTYIGSSLGVLATFIAFAFTYLQNSKQNKEIEEQNHAIQEQNKIIQAQNENSQKFAEEQTRLQALPFINMNKVTSHERCTEHQQFTLGFEGQMTRPKENVILGGAVPFEFINIGVGPAVNVKLSGESIGHFAPGESRTVEFQLPSVLHDFGHTTAFNITYSDRADREYSQEVIIVIKKSTQCSISAITPPKLENISMHS